MIIKLIEAKESGPRADGYARRLAAYMADADRQRLAPDAIGADYGLTLASYMIAPRRAAPARERVLHRGALVDGAETGWNEGVAEMERRLAHRSTRVKKPARHAVLSYRKGEKPSEAECAQAVRLLAEELGCEAAALLWAAHADTDNVHIHVLFVTIDAATGGAVPFGQEIDGRAQHKEAMQRAIARIEHEQHLQSEAGARYEVIDEHVVRKERSAIPSKPIRSLLRREIAEFEARSGFAAFTSVAQEIAAPLLHQARSWEEAHRSLAKMGMGVRRSGKGGELYGGDDHVKLSSVDRRLSWTKLTKADRLGAFEDAPVGLTIARYDPRILDAKRAQAWLGRQAAEKALKQVLDDRIQHLLHHRDAALADTRSAIDARRGDVAAFDGDPRVTRNLAAAWPRMQADATSRITAAFAARIAALRGLKHTIALEDDIGGVDGDALGALDTAVIAPWFWRGDTQPDPKALLGFQAERRGEAFCYWPNSNPDRRGQPTFVDTGPIIWVHDTSDESVAAVLKLAQARFGGVSVFGDSAYVARCRRVGEQLGVEVEEISRRQAMRKARRTHNGRTAARRNALDRHELQRWAERFARFGNRIDASLASEEAISDLGSIQNPNGLAATAALGHLEPELANDSATLAVNPSSTAPRAKEQRARQWHARDQGFDVG